MALEPPPLPFDHTALRGLSEPPIGFHPERDHGDAVENVLAAWQRLAEGTEEGAGTGVAGRMEREPTFRTSVAPHAPHVETPGANGVPGGAIAARMGDLADAAAKALAA